VVSYNPVDVGRSAAQLLFEHLESAAPYPDRQPARRVVIPTTLLDHPVAAGTGPHAG
jgi:LacI family transcriptional regulator